MSTFSWNLIKCNQFLILCMFGSVWSGLITAYFSTFFKFTGWQIFIITAVYYNRKKIRKKIKQKTKNNTLNLNCSLQDLTCTKLKTDCILSNFMKSRLNKVALFFRFGAYLTMFWMPPFTPLLNLEILFSQKALYRFFKKSSQVVILYIFYYIPSKNPEWSAQKPGGSF